MAYDVKNHILFKYHPEPSPTVVIVNALNGNIIDTLPTGKRVDTVTFNAVTLEAISAEGGGTMAFIKESSPTSFQVDRLSRPWRVPRL